MANMIRGIRGAITVKDNILAEILSAAEKLLAEIVKSNNINVEDIASVIFSATSDLNAVFPAEAARSMGWKFVPLLCTSEIDVPKGLKKCIRVLLHVNTNLGQHEIKHIYLDGAKVLREDIGS